LGELSRYRNKISVKLWICELRETCEEKNASLSEVVVEGLRYEDERVNIGAISKC
jgi:hypothetical protein